MRRSLALVRALVPFLTLSLSAGPARADTGPASPSSEHAAPTDGAAAPRPRRTGLFVAGLATLGVGYALSAAAGIDLLASSNGRVCNLNNGTCVAYIDPEGRDLLIPVVGPWLAFRDTRTLPILALLGLTQVTGVALTIAGTVRYAADGATAQSPPSRFISFGVLPTRDGAFGLLSGRM